MNKRPLFVLIVIADIYPKVGPLTRIISDISDIQDELDILYRNHLHEGWRWFVRIAW